jgi:hypothetical protein
MAPASNVGCHSYPVVGFPCSAIGNCWPCATTICCPDGVGVTVGVCDGDGVIDGVDDGVSDGVADGDGDAPTIDFVVAVLVFAVVVVKELDALVAD